MDRVRFGRALGFGARQAMKTLVTAVDAATAENPGKKPAARAAEPHRPAGLAGSAAAARTVQAPANSAAQTRTAAKKVAQAKQVTQGVRRGSKRFGEAVWNPFVRLSGVLWLELTGVFFGIFALFALGTVLRLRGDWHLTATNAANHRSLIGAVLMLAVFGYFCVSSFVRARRRERRR